MRRFFVALGCAVLFIFVPASASWAQTAATPTVTLSAAPAPSRLPGSTLVPATWDCSSSGSCAVSSWVATPPASSCSSGPRPVSSPSPTPPLAPSSSPAPTSDEQPVCTVELDTRQYIVAGLFAGTALALALVVFVRREAVGLTR